MTSTQLIRQLFPGTRTISWDHYYDLSAFELVLSAFVVNGAPRHQEQSNLLNNASGLIGLGKGFGQLTPSILPLEWAYLWACHQTATKVQVNENRAMEWGIIFQPPESVHELADYVEKVYSLKHQGIAQLEDIRAWLNAWCLEIRLCYAYATYGRAALEPDVDLGRYSEFEGRDRKRLIGPLHQAWDSARLGWENSIRERDAQLQVKRSPIKRVWQGRDAATKRRQAAKGKK